MRLRTIVSLIVSLFVLQLPIGDRFAAIALASGGSTANVCNDAAPFATLPADDAVFAQPMTSLALSEVALAKAQANDPESANRDLATGNPEAIAARLALKDASVRSGRGKGSASVFSDRAAAVRACGTQSASLASTIAGLADALTSRADATIGSGSGWVDNLNQQGQVRSYYCGPATVSEVARTMYTNGRGAIPADQYTTASYMGTTTSGTNVNNFVAGLNAYVGRPVAGWNWYAFVWLSYSPTASERSTFVSELEYDVQHGWPVGGDAWEEAYGPHLKGHPYNQTIYHYIELGGYGSSGASVYYADSATTIWSTVPRYSWFDMQTMITILGGRGYAW
ncbi:MAG: C39 family peptidase [Chloroflexota bacterium]